MVVEGHAAALLGRAGGWFSDVVHQRRPAQLQVRACVLEFGGLAQHGQRVAVDVLVLHVLVGLQLQRGNLGQNIRSQTGGHQQVDALPGKRAEHEFVQLSLYALSGDPLDLRGHVAHRVEHPVRHGEAKLGDEAGRAQHAQRIVAERHLGLLWGVQHLLHEVRESVDGVVEGGGEAELVVKRKLNGHGVAGEVAADEVALERVAEGDLGVAGHAVVEVGAEGGDLHDFTAADGGDGAELDAGVPHLLAPLVQDLLDHLRARGGGEVEVVHPAAEHRVAHRAADHI